MRGRGELVFVGLGLHPRQVTLEGLEALKTSDRIYVELYTSYYEGFLEELKRLLGVEINVLSRRELEEEGGRKLFADVKRGLKVALASIGDPFIATTHRALLLEALRRGVKVRIIHGVSIMSVAASASGLFAYKFGRSATVVYPKEGILYTYPYYVIEENKSRGLHTLLLLEMDPERGVFMTANDAMRILLDVERAEGKGVFTEETLVVVLARAGTPTGKVYVGKVGRLISRDFGPPPHSIVVPGTLHLSLIHI